MSFDRNSNKDFESYFEETFQVIKAESIKSKEIDWDELKQSVKDCIQFNSYDDVLKAISYTIELINDGHSTFWYGYRPDRLTIDTFCVPEIEARIIEDSIAYLRLPGFMANDSLTKEYSKSIRETVLRLDKQQLLSGWIIDLRKNRGGKMSRECLGLAPLFKDPLVGIAVNNKGEFRYTTCDSNYFYHGDLKMDSLMADLHLINNDKKIAVLINERTASGGEFLALAFKFQDNTKVFGQRTKGLTSHLQLYTFDESDAKMFLAFEKYCDKDKNIIEGSILPDIECKDEICLSKATEWINSAK